MGTLWLHLETHWGHLTAQEHRGEIWICDADVVKCDLLLCHAVAKEIGLASKMCRSVVVPRCVCEFLVCGLGVFPNVNNDASHRQANIETLASGEGSASLCLE